MAAAAIIVVLVLAQKGCDLHNKFTIYDLRFTISKKNFAENWKMVQPANKFNINPAEANAPKRRQGQRPKFITAFSNF
jgi:hypothetical protein